MSTLRARFHKRHLEPEKMPWRPLTLDPDVNAYAFAADTLLVAGGTPVGPHHRGAQLRRYDGGLRERICFHHRRQSDLPGRKTMTGNVGDQP